MSKKLLEFITNEDGDWEIIRIDEEIYYENHSIPSYIWLEIIESLDCEVKEVIVTQEDMEHGKY